MNSTAIKWGVIGGLISIIAGLLVYILGFADAKPLQYIIMFFMLIPIYLGQKEHKKLSDKDEFGFGELFKFGMIVLLVIAILSTLGSYMYITFIDTGLIERAMLMAEEDMLKRGMSDKEVDQAMEMSKQFMTPVVFTVVSFLSTLFFGLVFNVAASLSNKTK